MATLPRLQSEKNERGVLNHRLDFESWDQFIDCAESAPTDCRRRCSRSTERYGWFETKNFGEAVKLAREGWDEGRQKCNRLSSVLFDRIASLIERSDIVMDVEGSGFDIARLLTGEPDHWMRLETQIVEGIGRRVFRLIFNVTVSGGLSANVIITRGSTVASLVNLIEFSGHGVELVIASGVNCPGNSGREHFELFAPVKLADQPLDMGRVAFALAHPSLFRRMVFGIEECLPADIRRRFSFDNGSYGTHPFDVSDKGDIYIAGSVYRERDWENERVAVEWIIGELEKLGVHVREEAA